jgi:hypothetical protein
MRTLLDAHAELPGERDMYSVVAENFSVTRGGPFYRYQCRVGAAREERIYVARRAVLAVALTWLPLLLLSAAQGLALGKEVRIPFLRDFAVNARLLIALPLLILSELGIDERWRTIVNHFLKSGLVTEAALPGFESVLEKVTRLRDRVAPEVVLLVLAYLTSYFRSSDAPIGVIPSWHLSPHASDATLSSAGWWFSLVSLPLYRFLLLRWVWRMYLWAYFVWEVSRMKLELIPAHPDRAAGLGFLSGAQQKLGPIAFAIGAVVAGQLENAIAYEGATVAGLKYVILGYCICATLILVAPLLLLISTLVPVKRTGLLDYGALAANYTQAFDAKWVHGMPPASETLLGSSDIQSLADLGNSYEVVREMRVLPINTSTLVSLALTAALPMVPILVFETPTDQLLGTLLKLIS